MINVGIVSFAHSTHPERYLHALLMNPSVNLVGVWDDEPQRAKRHTDPIGVKFYDDLNALLSECDAVVISSRYDQHREHLNAALSKGLRVLCEKPLTHTAQELAGLEEDLRDSDRDRVMIAFPCRYIPGMKQARGLYRDGELGELLSINITNRGACPHSWFIDKEKSGGGAIMDHTAHAADLIRWITGEEFVSVHTTAGSNVHGMNLEDSFFLQLKLSGGGIALLDGSWTRQTPLPSTFDVTARILGTTASVEIDALKGHVSTYADGVEWDVYTGSIDVAMVNDFVDWVRTNQPTQPPIPFESGVEATRLSFRAYESLRTTSVVGM